MARYVAAPTKIAASVQQGDDGEGAMDARGRVRWGSLAGLFGAPAVLIVAIVGLTAGHDPQEWARQDVAAVLSSMSENTTLYLLSMWGFVLAYTLLMVFAIGVDQALPGRRGILGIAAWPLILGLMSLNMLALLAVGMTLGLADAYVGAADTEIGNIETLALSLFHFENHARALAYMLLATGVLLFGLRVLKSTPSPLPRWIGWTGVVGGALGFAGSLRLGPEFLFVLSTAGNFVQLVGFITPAGYLMFRMRELPVETVDPQHASPATAPGT